jgi:hypothetical protein
MRGSITPQSVLSFDEAGTDAGRAKVNFRHAGGPGRVNFRYLPENPHQAL